jgi:hypothetical protein
MGGGTPTNARYFSTEAAIPALLNSTLHDARRKNQEDVCDPVLDRFDDRILLVQGLQFLMHPLRHCVGKALENLRQQ